MEDWSGRARRFYDERWRKERPREKPSDILAEAVKIIPPGETLDLGAGDGRNSIFLARHGCTVTAVDFSPEAVRVIEERAQKEHLAIKTVLGDVQSWVPEHQYDTIVCTHLLQLLEDGKARESLRRIQDATKSGGWNVMDTWVNEGDQHALNSASKNFYVRRGEMPALYKGWDIFLYDEQNTKLYKKAPDGGTLWNVTARLIAQKPKDANYIK